MDNFMKYVIKVITNNEIISYLGGNCDDYCHKVTKTFSSEEETANALLENFEVFQLDKTTYRHLNGVLPTLFLIEPLQHPE